MTHTSSGPRGTVCLFGSPSAVLAELDRLDRQAPPAMCEAERIGHDGARLACGEPAIGHFRVSRGLRRGFDADLCTEHRAEAISRGMTVVEGS